MTENENSPENLRKFLESDDIESIMTGVMLADEAGIVEEVFDPMDLVYVFDWDDDHPYPSFYWTDCLRATEALGKLDNLQVVKILIKLFTPRKIDSYDFDHPMKITEEEVEEMDNPEAISYSIESLKPSPEVLDSAAKSLSRTKNIQAIRPLIEAIEHGDSQLQNAASKGLVNIGEPAIESLIESGHIDLLPRFGKKAIKPLIEALKNEHFIVRISSVEALARIGGERAIEGIIKALEDENLQVRISSVQALASSKKAIEPLVKTLLKREERILWKESGAALKNLGWKPDTDELRIPYFHAIEDWDALIDLGHSAVEYLIQVINGKIWEHNLSYQAHHADRNQSALALGEIGDTRAVEPLIKALGEGNSAAAEALRKIGGERVVERLNKILKDETLDNVGLKQQVATILDNLGWKFNDYSMLVSQRLATSGLKISSKELKQIEDISEKLLSKEKVLNLEQEEFINIVKARGKTLENHYTAKELIELLSMSTSQVRWLVACGIVETSFSSIRAIAVLVGTPEDIIKQDIEDRLGRGVVFWPEISAYPDQITRNDRDEIVKVLKSLPPVLTAHIGKSIYNFAIKAFEQKEVSDVMKKNRKMITTIFEDPTLAKDILGPLSR